MTIVSYAKFFILHSSFFIYKKKGKLFISHRYNQTPLLYSYPGGFNGSWSYKTCPNSLRCTLFLCSSGTSYEVQRYNVFLLWQKKI